MSKPVDFLTVGRFNPLENKDLEDLMNEYKNNPEKTKEKVCEIVKSDFIDAVACRPKMQKHTKLVELPNGELVLEPKLDDSVVSIFEIEEAIREKDSQIQYLSDKCKKLTVLANKELSDSPFARKLHKRKYQKKEQAEKDLIECRETIQRLHSDIEKLHKSHEAKLRLVYMIAGRYVYRQSEEKLICDFQNISKFVDDEFSCLEELSLIDFEKAVSEDSLDESEYITKSLMHSDMAGKLITAKDLMIQATGGKMKCEKELNKLIPEYNQAIEIDSSKCLFQDEEFVKELFSINLARVKPEKAEFILFLRAECEKFAKQFGGIKFEQPGE